MIAYSATTEIDVAPEVVWAALMDLGSWPRWASFHPRAHGTVATGEPVTVRFTVRGLLRIPGRARFMRVEPERSLWWTGGLPPILRVEHGFDLEPTERGTRLRHEERFGGLLGPLVVGILGSAQEGKYAEVNEALKAILETGV